MITLITQALTLLYLLVTYARSRGDPSLLSLVFLFFFWTNNSRIPRHNNFFKSIGGISHVKHNNFMISNISFSSFFFGDNSFSS